jgi:hypothetical protein
VSVGRAGIGARLAARKSRNGPCQIGCGSLRFLPLT